MGLSQKKYRAIEMILLGYRDQEIAMALHITKATARRWQTENVFKEELDRFKKEQWDESKARISCILSRAIDIVAQAINLGDKKMSLEIMRIYKPMPQEEKPSIAKRLAAILKTEKSAPGPEGDLFGNTNN